MNPLTILRVYSTPILLTAIVILVGGLAAFGKVQTARLETCKTASEAFKADVKAEGAAAAKEAARVNLANQKGMDTANAKITKLSTDNAALLKRLRSNNPPQSRLPDAPADTSRPDLLCVDRAEYQREDGIIIAKLFEGARSLADEGTANTMKLSTAEEWARSIGR